MGNMIANGLTWLERQRAAHMSSPAVYRHAGADLGFGVDVTQTQVRYERLPPDHAPVEARAVDFLLAAAAVSEAPQAGDQIEIDGRAYEVTPLGGEPCWRWTDAGHNTRRIHAREVSL